MSLQTRSRDNGRRSLATRKRSRVCDQNSRRSSRGAPRSPLQSRDAGPIAYGTRGRPFSLDRVLAWTTDSLSAIVLGRWGDQTGLFVLDGGAGDGLDPPRYLGPSSGLAHAAFSQRDVGFVVDGPVLSYVRDGVLVPLPLPADAPAPDGPIVWIP